jgi:hypothetical protein
MKIFFRLSLSKIIITIIILLVVFVGNFLYSTTFTVTQNGLKQTNFLLVIVNTISDIIYYPVHFILSFIPITINISTYQNNPLSLLFITIISVLLTIIESYIISCIIAFFIGKVKHGV